jgi:hypothetical protein
MDIQDIQDIWISGYPPGLRIFHFPFDASSIGHSVINDHHSTALGAVSEACGDARLLRRLSLLCLSPLQMTSVLSLMDLKDNNYQSMVNKRIE